VVSVSQRDAAGNVTLIRRRFTVAPPALLPLAPAVADTTAPSITLPRTVAWRGRRLFARPSVGEAGSARVSLRLGRSVLAVAKRTVQAPGRLTVRLKPSRRALARLRTRRPRKLVLVVTATDGAGNARTVRRSVKLTR
jgi:hypothetical protein